MVAEFAYDAAFARNLGWLTEAEQLALRGMRVAIAGMGGVGGVHLLTLARLGIGAFNIADFDEFALVNFNRQIGANIHTVDRPKAHVLQEMALAINPKLRINRFDEGVTHNNLEAFLSGVDLFVDGFDFFVMGMRRRVYARCHELGIPAICAGPIGMSTGFLAFSPQGMSFEQYFGMEGRSEEEQYLRFLVGLVPKALHRPYLVDPTRLNLAAKTGPSIGAACELCAGVAAITAIKFLLRRGDPLPVPWNQQYDAFRGILRKTWLRNGLNGPVLGLKLKLFGPAIIARMRSMPLPPETFYPRDLIDEILHMARWAPSADNEQPWRFEKVADGRVLVHIPAHDARDVHQYRNGEPNLLATGMLLETLRIAASAHGRRMEWRVDAGPDPLRLSVEFIPDQSVEPDPLEAAVGLRSVDRNRYRMRNLTAAELEALERALGEALKIDWYTSAAERWRIARLGAVATSIRLREQEVFRINQRIIDWGTNLSTSKIPAGALGLSRVTRVMLRWALASWRRMSLVNSLGGTIGAAVELDIVPNLFSAAAFTLRCPTDNASERRTEDVLRAGIHVQRFWLTATLLGLALHPALAILVFAQYGQGDPSFGSTSSVRAKARRLARKFQEMFGRGVDEYVFIGRIGEPLRRTGVSRSVRLSVAELTVRS